MVRTSHLGSALAIAALLLGVSGARGQERPPARDPAAAEALFTAALEALDHGNWAVACPKFDASMKLDPSVGTLLNVAKCHMHDGKLALAWADCQRALVLNRETLGAKRQAELDAFARKTIADLEARLPKLRVAVASRPEGLAVTRDGEELPSAMIGEAVPIDPGSHAIVVSAPGFRTERRTVEVAEGGSAELEVTLARDPDAGRAPPKPPPVADTGGGGVPTWAWVAGGLGALCVAGSVVFLVDERSTQSRIDSQCTGPGHTCGTFDPSSDNSRLNRDFGLFLGLGIAGLGGIGAAVVGIASASSKPAPVRAAAWVAPGGAVAVLEGSL